ncbi:MAG: AAA family ATPase, partial [Verrucomicrobiota bacterium]
MSTTPTPAARFKLLPDRTYSFEDILNREHPAPDPVDTRPLPALPPPRFLFDRDALTIGFKANGETFKIDLAAVTVRGAPLRFLDDAGKEIAPPTDFLERRSLEVRGEIEAAAWEVFHNRRHYRAGLFSNDIPDFDVFDALRDGATLDWHLGAILWPKQGPLLKHAVPIFDLEPDDDDSGNFVQSRYLCRGGSMLISGPTGIGKSSLAMQLALAWALGKPCLGFSPGRPLATLIVQSENDAGDLMEQRDGIIAGLGLDEQADGILNEMVSVATVDDCSGRDFFVRLERLIRDWQPDIIILDPLLAFVGGDLSRQEVAADFLR